jgi:hypothetical protein
MMRLVDPHENEEGIPVAWGITCDAPGCDRAARGYVITSHGMSTHVDLCTEHSEPVALVMSWGRPGQGPDVPPSRRRRQKGEDALGSMPNFDDDPANGHTHPN